MEARGQVAAVLSSKLKNGSPTGSIRSSCRAICCRGHSELQRALLVCRHYWTARKLLDDPVRGYPADPQAFGVHGSAGLLASGCAQRISAMLALGPGANTTSSLVTHSPLIAARGFLWGGSVRTTPMAGCHRTDPTPCVTGWKPAPRQQRPVATSFFRPRRAGGISAMRGFVCPGFSVPHKVPSPGNFAGWVYGTVRLVLAGPGPAGRIGTGRSTPRMWLNTGLTLRVSLK
ncbi:hypothetical protein JOF46_000346 [Paeniglutamicibacter psychrophenolicus]|uniref:Uncharacterized protein n=1 Tax=Paeniglutamicibacter psychrophenolicus TaxID=257454 RepID=A0ABS4W8A4_9MICC|nr:hypothetical protein [Paeniglutamicibacter psychrophenolicus]